MKKISLISASLLLLAAACAPKNFENIQQIAQESTGAIGCENFESRTWNAVDRYLIEQREIPSAEELKEHLKLSLKELKGPQDSLTEEKLDILSQKMSELFDILLAEAPEKEQIKNSDELLALLSALELGDHTTEARVYLQSRVKAQFAQIQKQVHEMQVQCQLPEEESPLEVSDPRAQLPVPDIKASRLPLPVFGMRFSIATAYQSCQALDEPIMTASTPQLEGIKITGKHSDGVGNKRDIASLTSLIRTHHYYKNVNNYGPNCLNPQSSPMIYDYGGKPYATTSSSSTLDFFKNSGSGTKVLGMDCSGLVYSALATAGLRVTANKNNKATGVYGISSTMYMEPQKNGLSCLEKITVTPNASLRAGDVVAVRGHVLMIDSIGSDPFGLNDIKTISQCSSLTAKNFDFVVAQSSPSKAGIGINRYQARDYLQESEKMREGLQRYAYYACLARFNNKSYTPSGETASVVRHKQTSACLGTRVKLAKESCVQSCPQLTN